MFVITGCGRSGTGYIQSRLKSAGIRCGHEEVFTPKGFSGWKDFDGDSSWYAAPFIHTLKNVKVVHVVRDPKKVIQSFYRLGIFSTLGWRNFVINPDPLFLVRKYVIKPNNITERTEHVRSIRSLIRQHTTSLCYNDEIKRIERYWLEWNDMIEKNQDHLKENYVRIRLEELHTRWDDIITHIGSSKNIESSDAVNKKVYYVRKKIKKIELSGDVINVAKKYGYDY